MIFYKIQSIDAKLLQQWSQGDSFPYVVHSRFTHAINYVNQQNDMITFLTRGLPNAPKSMIIDVDEFNEWPIEEGEHLQHQSDQLLLSNIGISIGQAVAWSMDLPSIQTVDVELLEAMQHFLDSHQTSLFEMEQMIYDRLDEYFFELISAAMLGDYEMVTTYARKSIGLGLGLTPSGDDRLVGFLLGCYIYSPMNTGLYLALKTAIEESQENTNEISYAMLNAAKHGEFNEWLLTLANVIGMQDSQNLSSALTNVFSIGSRSGGDMIKGLLLFLTHCPFKN